MALEALLWDVDGTLSETERDGHRRAFNRAFAEAGLPIHWDEDSYADWLHISGGAERIHAVLRSVEGVNPDPERVALLQRRKQSHYADLVESGVLRLRSGVSRLLAEAQAAGLRQVIVTTSGRNAVAALLARLLPNADQLFTFRVCGEDVQRKKPDPEAYALAAARLAVPPARLLAIEDSIAGLEAACAAGVPCVISRSHYGGQEPVERFSAARAVLSGLGAGFHVLAGPACPDGSATLSYLQGLL
jgi:HAD superfamily hydrolase (TIGR01509 family)